MTAAATTDNPVVPGLFPSMTMDESQFDPNIPLMPSSAGPDEDSVLEAETATMSPRDWDGSAPDFKPDGMREPQIRVQQHRA